MSKDTKSSVYKASNLFQVMFSWSYYIHVTTLPQHLEPAAAEGGPDDVRPEGVRPVRAGVQALERDTDGHPVHRSRTPREEGCCSDKHVDMI